MTTTKRIPVTFFASPERSTIDVVKRQADAFRENSITFSLLNSVLNCVFVLNQHRQIVFASQNAMALMPGKKLEDVLGKRPGEALGCVHAHVCESGCGTSEFCSQCGAVSAILASLNGGRGLKECHLSRRVRDNDESMDLLVLAVPFNHKGEQYSVVSLADVSHENRRKVLERIFYHDVINLAGGAAGLLEVLAEKAPVQFRQELNMASGSVHQILEEIQTQRAIVAAERDELTPDFRGANSRDLINIVVSSYRCHSLAVGVQIVADTRLAAISFNTDPSLLLRVLGNLVKNAVEASKSGDTVVVDCQVEDKFILFRVHNPAVISRDIQLQLFKRSFSTKGMGRGLGTYSVKMLTEKYLDGKVSFSSAEGQGTTFTVTLPVARGQ